MTLLLSTLTAFSVSMLSASQSFQEDINKNKAKNKKPEIKVADILKKLSKDRFQTSNEQDELSADVQDLIQEQADPNVVKLLNKVEDLMGEATEKLENQNTSGDTIAIQTEIIETMYEAAKEKQQSSSS